MLASVDARDRARHHDRAAGLHVRHGRLGHVKVAIEVGLDGAVEMLFGQILEAGDVLLERGIVDQDVELAELRDGLLYSRLAESKISDVAGDRNAAPSFSFHQALGFFGIDVLVEIDNRHVGAFAGIKDRHRAADARIAPRDQRDHVEQLVGPPVVGRFRHWLRLELRLKARLAQMLRGKRAGIGPGARLHRSGLLVLYASGGLIGAIDLLLDVPLSARGLFGILGERLQALVRFTHGSNVRAVSPARLRPCTEPLGQRDHSCAPAQVRPQPRRVGRTQACGHLPLAALPWARPEFGSARPGAKPPLPALPDSWQRSADAAQGRYCQVALTRRLSTGGAGGPRSRSRACVARGHELAKTLNLRATRPGRSRSKRD